MKRLLAMMVMVVLAYPLLSSGKDTDDVRKSGNTGSYVRTKDDDRSTLTGGQDKKLRDDDDKDRYDKDDDSKSISTITSTSPSPQPSGINTLGLGTATIDGVMSPGEWDNAVKIDFQANIPPIEGGGTTPATLYIMNDGLNLYIAVKIARPSFGYQTLLTFDFDNNNTGVAADGDDGFQMYVGNSLPPTFIDTYRYTCPNAPAGSAGCIAADTDPTGGILPAGTNDGVAAATNNGSVTIIEVSKLLSSKDVLHDFSLKPGSKVGYHATLRLSVTTANTGRIGGGGTISYAVTELPATGTGYLGQITIATPVVTRSIEIKGGGVSSINRNSEGKIPVAILSAADFNAPMDVDRSSLTFGRTGNEQSLAFCNEGFADVNGDGLPDLICHFSTQIAGFQPGDKFGILNGKTKNGVAFTATYPVRIVQ